MRSDASARRPHVRGVGGLVLIAIFSGLATITASPADARPPHFCGHRSIHTKVGPMKLYFRTEGMVTCGAARATVRGYFRQPISACIGSGCFIELRSGWNCHSAPGAVTEHQGSVAACERHRGEEQIATSRFRNRGFEFEENHHE